MKIDWHRTELLLRRAEVLHKQGRSEEFDDLVGQFFAAGANEFSALKIREIKTAQSETNSRLMDCNEQIVESLIDSYSTTESKEWREEAAKRLSDVLRVLEGMSDYLEAEIDIESYDLSVNEVKIEEHFKRILNRDDEFYKILVDASSWLIEDRSDSIKQRERAEELMMKIRATGI
ncbi:hypothetical protein M2F95_15000 [Vibrio vulnificus]|nr:hypothetical protein [Vibrio vulnificus]EKG2505343.1 hypothetical protein [Vibrio vulnificus]MCU8552454.1 hypothetical protein [Vibrio vulnificus]HAS8093103.1 hypothetical protein [Vibrio vulnificus]HDU8730003.1 hypothetical protein [Vibrio vulnificus]